MKLLLRKKVEKTACNFIGVSFKLFKSKRASRKKRVIHNISELLRSKLEFKEAMKAMKNYDRKERNVDVI